MSRKPTVTGPEAIERERRIADILALRVAGNSLQAIGDAQDPPVTAQAVHKTLKRAIERMADEAVEEARRIEALRLDEALAAIYPGVSAGDLVAIDRMLDIMETAQPVAWPGYACALGSRRFERRLQPGHAYGRGRDHQQPGPRTFAAVGSRA